MAWSGSHVDSFTVSLHSPNGRHLPAVTAVQGGCQWPFKTVIIPTAHVSPACNALGQPTTQPATRPNGSHASHPTDSPIATRLRLWSSLAASRRCQFPAPVFSANVYLPAMTKYMHVKTYLTYVHSAHQGHITAMTWWLNTYINLSWYPRAIIAPVLIVQQLFAETSMLLSSVFS